MKRRDFIQLAGRGIFATTIIGGGIWLSVRNKQGDEACDYSFVCGNCSKKNKCTLPEARAYKDKFEKDSSNIK